MPNGGCFVYLNELLSKLHICVKSRISFPILTGKYDSSVTSNFVIIIKVKLFNNERAQPKNI